MTMQAAPALTTLVALALAAPVLPAQDPAAATITAGQFASLRWLEGAWRGSGGGYDAFYEDFRWLDDSTVARHTFADSTLARVTEESRWELRGGVMRSVSGGTTRSVAVLLRGDSLQFAPPRGSNRVLFVRRSDDAWTALIGPPGDPRITYEMSRYRP
jgi:hypothetical protein